MRKTTFIYALYDPRKPEEIRYIGKSNNPKRRAKDHLRCKTSNYKDRWIQSLLNEGVTPELKILEEVPFSTWQEKEREHMAQARKMGFRLTNTSAGGDGMGYLSWQERQKKSKDSRGENCFWYGKKLSEKHRKNLRETKRSVSREFEVFDKTTGEKVGRWYNQNQCARELKIHVGNLNKVLMGKYPSVGGYVFQLVLDGETTEERLSKVLKKMSKTKARQ